MYICTGRNQDGEQYAIFRYRIRHGANWAHAAPAVVPAHLAGPSNGASVSRDGRVLSALSPTPFCVRAQNTFGKMLSLKDKFSGLLAPLMAMMGGESGAGSGEYPISENNIRTNKTSEQPDRVLRAHMGSCVNFTSCVVCQQQGCSSASTKWLT